MQGIRLHWCWLVLCGLTTGCAGSAPFFADSSGVVDANWGSRRNQLLANRAWTGSEETKKRYWSDAYREGFVAGYRSVLESGSASEPPVSFWSRYGLLRVTAEEEQAKADWSAGFRYGSGLAQENRLAALLTSPQALPYAAAGHPSSQVVLATAKSTPDAKAAVQSPGALPDKAGSNFFGMDWPKLTLQRQRAPLTPSAPWRPQETATAALPYRDQGRPPAVFPSATPAEGLRQVKATSAAPSDKNQGRPPPVVPSATPAEGPREVKAAPPILSNKASTVSLFGVELTLKRQRAVVPAAARPDVTVSARLAEVAPPRWPPIEP